MSIKRIALLCATFLLFTATISAQESDIKSKFLKPETVQKSKCDKYCWGGRAVLAAGIGLDYASSVTDRTGIERNPFLRDKDGFSHSRYWLANGGAFVVTEVVRRKWPRGATVLQYVVGGVKLFVAVRNFARE